jgi:putative sigma-54 modulation protein
MQINITGHRMDVTPALKAFTKEKFNRLERHFDHITSINVVYDVEKLRQIAEATVFVSKGELHASSESEDMYAAIDSLVDKLNRQLIKHKEKLLGLRDHKSPRDMLGEHRDQAE